MAKKRIPITVTDAELATIQTLMKQENRSRAYIATMVFQDGLKLTENGKATLRK